MKTSNLEAIMKTQSQMSTGTRETPRRVTDQDRRSFGVPALGLALLFCLGWLALPGGLQAQPANYTNETVVANYVKGLLYWPDAAPADKNSAAFRYKHLLYIDYGGIRPDFTNMADLYTAADRTKSQLAEAELIGGLTNHPDSTILGELLLDIYYDRTVAEAIFAREALEKAELAHFGPPIAAPAPLGGFIIDNEIAAYEAALQSNRVALATYFTLLTNSLGVADVAGVPLGYRLFQEDVPTRGLDPASYVSNNVVVCVSSNSSPLFTSYKDVVLLYELLSDQGRTASTLARLRLLRNSPGDINAAESLLTEVTRSLFLHTHLLRTAFPDLNPEDASLANSGVGVALEGVAGSLAELENVRQLQRGGLNPLGFDPDFLVLVQDAFSGEAPQPDSYDAFLVHLADANSALGQATNALGAARNSYTTVRESEDELASHFDNSSITYMDRLRDIVGVFPDDPRYGAYPEGAPGSELNQQFLSISNALLTITNVSVQMNNVYEKIDIEVGRTNTLNEAYITYGNKRASLAVEISKIKARQAGANAIADAVSAASGATGPWAIGASLAAGAANAAVQIEGELAQGAKESELENLAAKQDAKIEGINSAAQIKTWMLELNTLAVDLQAAVLQLQQEVNLRVSLYREKADLERILREKDSHLAHRFFTDPVHRLSMRSDMAQADLKFREAQKWLFFMARALEYKWNEPFVTDNGWTLASLFKLRNADELWNMYLQMKSLDDGEVLYSTIDDRWDWLSLREDVLGYRQYGNNGELLSYLDPATGETVDALTMFRRYLERHQDARGVIGLDFSTVLQNHNTFFRGPSTELGTPGQYLDKIDCMVIRLPGQHTTTNYTQWDTLSGALGYGGSSYLRNKYPGSPAPGRPDLLINEMTDYSTRWWYETTNGWRFREVRTNMVSMLKANPAAPRLEHDFPSDIPDRLATHALIINTFRERSVATSRWILRIPTRHPTIPGMQTLRIGELDDIEIYFYHWSYERP